MTSRPRAATRRLFFALWPSEAERSALADATQAAVAAAAGRAIAPESLHMTLAFLGNVAAVRIGELADLGRTVAAAWNGHAPLVLSFERLAYWPQSQILCAQECEERAGAAALAAALKRAATEAGFAPDLKPFRAHVTVARKVARAASVAAMQKVTWRCESWALTESRNGAAGTSVYSVLESQLLGKAGKVREKH